MGALEKALTELNEVERMACTGSRMHSIDPRAKLIVTVIYIVVVLSFALDSPAGIILFWMFPIIVSAMSGISYNAVFVKSLYTLPFIMFIGIFNPIFNREPMLYIGDMAISRGWVEFVSIIIRGLLSVQAVLLLIMSTGFNRLCAAMGKLGVPSIFTTQLMLLYRYIFVLLDEALSMDRARTSRSYGRKKYGLKMWGTFIGQLLLRTVERAQRIHRAMLSRGFTGKILMRGNMHWRLCDTIYVVVWCLLFAAGRFCDVSGLFPFTR